MPWLAWDHEGSIRGYAYASKWKGRCAYRHSAEVTVYLAPKPRPAAAPVRNSTRHYSQISANVGFHTAIGGIALPNPASIALHERLGFRKVAHFEQVGWKLGRWIDVGYWQLLLGE